MIGLKLGLHLALAAIFAGGPGPVPTNCRRLAPLPTAKPQLVYKKKGRTGAKARVEAAKKRRK